MKARFVLEFLEDGLIRNATGKVFQAWKTVVAALAAEHRDELKPIYPGSCKIQTGDIDMVVFT